MGSIILNPYIIKNINSKKKYKKYDTTPRKLGKIYKIRILVTVLLTIGLTWYAKQRKNNPFEPLFYTIVGINKNTCYVYFKKENTSISNNTLLLLTGKLNNNVTDSLLSNSRSLITFTNKNIFENTQTNPQISWYSLNIEKIINNSSQLIPKILRKETTINSINIFAGNEKTNGLNTLYVEFGKLKLLIVQSKWKDKKPFNYNAMKEKYDVVIAVNTNTDDALQIRNDLRPKEFIYIPLNKKIDKIQKDNIINLRMYNGNIKFRIDPRGKLIIDKKDFDKI